MSKTQLHGERMVPFACLGSECPKTCCGPFEGAHALRAILSPADLGEPLDKTQPDHAHAVSIFAQIRLTDEDVARLRDAGYDRHITYRGDAHDPHYYLKLREDGGCSALSANNTCTIHPDRPTICRAFPFYIDLFAGLCLIEACPGVGNGAEQPMERLEEEYRAALKMYRFWTEIILAE